MSERSVVDARDLSVERDEVWERMLARVTALPPDGQRRVLAVLDELDAAEGIVLP